MSKPNPQEGAPPVMATTTTTTTVVTDTQSSHEAQTYGLDAIERRRVALQEVRIPSSSILSQSFCPHAYM